MHIELTISDGAALIHTSPSHPTSYTHLRTYLLHRLYSIPIPAPDDSALHTNSYTETDQSAHTAALANSRFPFLYRANVLDKEAVLVPTGWDSWGKIKVVREGYEPEGVLQGLEDSLARGMGKSGKGMGEEREEVMGKEEGSEGLEGLEGVWRGMMPELEGGEVCSILVALALRREQVGRAGSLESLAWKDWVGRVA